MPVVVRGMVAVLAMFVVVVVVVVAVIVGVQEVGVDVQLGVEVEARRSNTSAIGTSPKCTAFCGARGFMCLSGAQRIGSSSAPPGRSC
jgi:hypothetical protein